MRCCMRCILMILINYCGPRDGSKTDRGIGSSGNRVIGDSLNRQPGIPSDCSPQPRAAALHKYFGWFEVLVRPVINLFIKISGKIFGSCADSVRCADTDTACHRPSCLSTKSG